MNGATVMGGSPDCIIASPGCWCAVLAVQAIAIIQSIVIGLILAALYSDMPNNQTGIQDEIGIVCVGWGTE